MIKKCIKKIGIFVAVIIAFILLGNKVNQQKTEAATATKISTAAQLSQIVNNPYGNYELTTDIDVSGLELNEIYETYVRDLACFNICFEGTLDGKGHKITGVKQGLFRSVGTKGIIKNLDMEVDFSEDIGKQNRFGLAFENLGTIDNVNITCTTNSFIDTCAAFNSSYVHTNVGVIKNCITKLIIKEADSEEGCDISGVARENYGTITYVTAELDVSDIVAQRYVTVAGICKNNYMYATVSNCTIKGTMTIEQNGENMHTYLVGVVETNNGTVDKCDNYCNITAGMQIAGIVSYNIGIVKSCTNYGTITSNYLIVYISSEQGGIAASNGGILKDCVNNGKIVDNFYSDQNHMEAGGISGSASDYAVFDNCVNNGEVIDTTGHNFGNAGIVGEIVLDSFYFEGDERINNIGTVVFKNCINNASCPESWLVSIFAIACDESQIIVNNCSNTYSGLSMFDHSYIPNISEDRKDSIFLVCNDSDNGFRINNPTSTIYKGEQFILDIHNPNNSKYTVAGGTGYLTSIRIEGNCITSSKYGYRNELIIVYTDTGDFDYILLDVSGYMKVMLSDDFTIKQRAEYIELYGLLYEEYVRLSAKNSEILSVDQLANAHANKVGTTDVVVCDVTGGANPIRCVVEVVTPEEYNYSGWIQIDGKWFYYKDGKKLTGWVKDGKWYYMNTSGVMQTGWVKDGSKWYYMNKSGAMQTGWVKDGSKWYYMDLSGVMKTGWVKSSGKWYYMNSSGAMQTGWVKDGSKWYYLAKSGAMFTGWIQSGSKWYYTDSSGAMKTGWLKLSGKWYYFDGNGAMATGSRNIDGNVYYFDDDGVWIE